MDERRLLWGNALNQPCLLHPGRGRSWWRTPRGWVWHDGENLWVEEDLHVLVRPMGGQVEVDSCSSGWRLIRNSRGEWLRESGPQSMRRVDRRCDEGRDIHLFREKGGFWRAIVESQTFELAEGPASAEQCWAWRKGKGLFWRTDEWVYRQVWGAEARALCRHVEGANWVSGPFGAGLLVVRGEIVAGAPPGGMFRDLRGRLRTDGWGVRWSADGHRFFGLTRDEQPFSHNFEAPTELPGLPCGDGAHWLSPEGVVGDDRLPFYSLREASWAFSGLWLGGPGGVIWELTTGTPLFQKPILRLGATVATDRLWATVDWESGAGVWLDPATGSAGQSFQIPLEHGDWVESAEADGEMVVVTTTEEKAWSVWEDQVSAAPLPTPRPLPRNGHGWRLYEEGLQVAGWSGLWSLPLEAAARVGDRVFAWNSDGLLIAIPVPS